MPVLDTKNFRGTAFIVFLMTVGLSAQVASGYLFTDDAVTLLRDLGGITPNLFVEGAYWRLAAAWFLHGGLTHFIGNLWLLIELCAATDLLFGSRYTALSFFGGGLLASVSSAIFLDHEVAVGASGAIFAVAGALIVWLHRCSALRGQPWAKRLFAQVSLWSAMVIVAGLVAPYIDNASHIGGFVGGAVIAWLVPAKLRHRPAAAEEQPRGRRTAGHTQWP